MFNAGARPPRKGFQPSGGERRRHQGPMRTGGPFARVCVEGGEVGQRGQRGAPACTTLVPSRGCQATIDQFPPRMLVLGSLPPGQGPHQQRLNTAAPQGPMASACMRLTRASSPCSERSCGGPAGRRRARGVTGRLLRSRSRSRSRRRGTPAAPGRCRARSRSCSSEYRPGWRHAAASSGGGRDAAARLYTGTCARVVQTISVIFLGSKEIVTCQSFFWQLPDSSLLSGFLPPNLWPLATASPRPRFDKRNGGHAAWLQRLLVSSCLRACLAQNYTTGRHQRRAARTGRGNALPVTAGSTEQVRERRWEQLPTE